MAKRATTAEPDVDIALDVPQMPVPRRPASVGGVFREITQPPADSGAARDDSTGAATGKPAAKKNPRRAAAKKTGTPARASRGAGYEAAASSTHAASPAEESALASARSGQKASQSVPVPAGADGQVTASGQVPVRRVAHVPARLAASIAEECARLRITRPELVIHALAAAEDQLADLVRAQNAPELRNVGGFVLEGKKTPTGGTLAINLKLLPTNSDRINELVQECGARGVSQIVSVALDAYFGGSEN